jgi:hypothetical protein
MTTISVSPIIFWFSITLLWLLVYWFYRDYRVDLFRQRMFVIRGKLFDIALTETVAFDDPAYTRLRTQLNGFIRYGNKLNVPRTTVLFFAQRNEAAAERVREFEREWNEAITRLPEPTRFKVLALRAAMHLEVGKQVLLASPLVMLTFLPALLLLMMQLATSLYLGRKLRGVYRVCAQVFRRSILSPLDSLAFDFGADAALLGVTGDHAVARAGRF